MKINTLCQKLGISKVKTNHEIYSITDDSRECIDNSIFFAIRGETMDGNDKVLEAIYNGAKTIFMDHPYETMEGINIVVCKNVKRMLALALRIYHERIVKNLKIIGVIGTNGKTTTSTLLYKYLEYSGIPAMLIGSNGCYAKDFYKQHQNTTPKGTELYAYFTYAKYKKIKYVIMEVSSIAVSELRVLDIPYHGLIFTNFNEDHLDYHKTMDRYLFAKVIPFYQLQENGFCILNMDDPFSEYILKHTRAHVLPYGIQSSCRMQAKQITSTEYGVEFMLENNKIKSNLLGLFNAYNILPLFCFVEAYHLDDTRIPAFLSEFKQVEGRMNKINVKGNTVIIDYAHTEEAVRKAVEETIRITKGTVYVVVGCGGNREKEKRSKIGSTLSDLKCEVIVTSDNPRFENPHEIISDILKGISKDVTVIENRKEAIFYGLEQLNAEDTLLILGKGCEPYMDIEGHKSKYSDFATIEEWKGIK